MVASIVKTILNVGPEFGLFLNFSKSKVFWPSESRINDDMFHPDFTRPSDGITVLGVPVGTPEFVKTRLAEKFSKRSIKIKRLAQLNDPQIAFAILQKCLGISKINYFLRTLPCELTLDIAKCLDDHTMESLEIILGKDLSSWAKTQASLPVKSGGLGLYSAVSHAPAAFVSSINACSESIILFLKKPVQSLLDKSLPRFGNSILSLSKSQRVLSESINDQELKSLLSTANDETKARLLSCASSMAASLFTAPLSSTRGCKLTPQEFAFFLSTRLGLKNICNEGDRCRHCGSVMDAMGLHVMHCRMGDFSAIYRHNQIRNALFNECQRAAWNPKLEIVCPSSDASKMTPADIYLPVGPGTKPIALDITITHPCSKTIIDKSSKEPDAANKLAEEKKIRKYSNICSRAGISFKPLAFEIFGRPSVTSISFILKLSTAIANRFGCSPRSVVKDIERRLMTTLIRASAKGAASRIPAHITL